MIATQLQGVDEGVAQLGVAALDKHCEEVVAAVLTRMGIECPIDGDTFRVLPSRARAAGRITTGLWPGFPSDLISLVTVLATQADGLYRV